MTCRTDIAFVYPTRAFTGVSLDYNFGNASLIAFLRERGFNAEPIVSAHLNTASFIDQLRDIQPRLVGITCYDATFHLTRCLANIIMHALPSAEVIVGGPTATYSPAVILEAIPEVNVATQGEAEESTYRLLRLYETDTGALDRERLADIRGITYRANGRLLSTGRPRLTPDMNVLPSPILSDTIPADVAASIGVMMNRGCDHHCIYCAFASMNYRRVRSFSHKRVLAELDHLRRHRRISDSKITISFLDDNFLASPDNAIALCQALEHNNLGFQYFCQLRSELITPHVLNLLKRAGFKKVAFGLESNSPRLLGIIKKNARYLRGKSANEATLLNQEFVSQLSRNVAHCSAIGIRPVVSAIVGLPSETPADAQELLAFLEDLDLGPGQIALNPLYVACGTELFKRQRDLGISVRNVWTDSVNSLYCTALPPHVDNLPALSNSISYLQKRHEISILGDRLQGSPLDYMEQLSVSDFVFVDSFRAFREVLPALEMQSTVYVVARSERHVDIQIKRISRYLVAKKIPISIVRGVIVFEGRDVDCIPKMCPTLSVLDGPIRIFQLRAPYTDQMFDQLLMELSDLHLLLLVCNDTIEFERMRHRMMKTRTRATVAFSAYPLIGQGKELGTWLTLSLWSAQGSRHIGSSRERLATF